MRTTKWFLAAGVMFVTALIGVTACKSSPPPAPPAAASEPTPEYAPTATIKDIMLSIVDPSADVVWLSVTTIQSSEGIKETEPKSDEEWTKVRQGAIALTEAANLLMMPGRHVAPPGHKSETPGIELEPEEMEELINQDRGAWLTRAKGLHDAGVAVLAAIDAKDSQKVFEIGEQIEQACENCHKQYWYPNEKIPEFPSNLE